MNHTPLLSFMEGSAKVGPLYEQGLFRLEHLSSLFCLEVKFIFSSHILNMLYLCEGSKESKKSCSRILSLSSMILGRGQAKIENYLDYIWKWNICLSDLYT